MFILGVSAYYHDSAATLVKDGVIIAAVQEERFTRVKQDSSFPINSIKYCLKEGAISLDEIDKIVFYDDPKIKFKRILRTYIDFFPKSIPFIFKSLPVWLMKKQFWKKNLINEFELAFSIVLDEKKITNIEHHRSHAASAFFPSPFEDAAILVLDGVGEFDTTSLWVGEKNKLMKVASIQFPHSLGLLYSAITYYIGFKVNSGEYKVMGLAPYGEPKYVEIIERNLININVTGEFSLNMKYFDFAVGNRMTNENFHALFNRDPREPEAELTQFEMDMARSIQDVTESVMIKLANWVKEKTGKNYLCLAGGVALNCVGNGKILQEGIFEEIWIQPAAGDAGGSLGAALDYYYDFSNQPRALGERKADMMGGAYLGPSYTNDEIELYLKSVNAQYIKYDSFDELSEEVAEKLKEENVIGWHQGRMEFGPRSLGNRSILGDPRSVEMQLTMNLKIKYRESFRPFAPSVLEEKSMEWFDINVSSPYMLLVAPVKEDKRIMMTEEEETLFGIEKLNIPRSEIPAVTHVDYSARVQTVSESVNYRYYSLIKKFYEKTRCPILINTSFNVRGEPIVCAPEDSYRCFMRTGMDVLVIGDFLMHKAEQPDFEDASDWQKEFQLD